MSNLRLTMVLLLILMVLLALVALEVYRHGSYAGLGAGIYLVPILFVVSLLVSLALGLRKRGNRAGRNESGSSDDRA